MTSISGSWHKNTAESKLTSFQVNQWQCGFRQISEFLSLPQQVDCNVTRIQGINNFQASETN